MSPRLQWRPYRRNFTKPLKVSGQTWKQREGIIVRAEHDDGTVGYGEVAPVPWFPVESLKESSKYLASIEVMPVLEDLSEMAVTLPCTAYALSCALLPTPSITGMEIQSAGLLPSSKELEPLLKERLDAGYSTLKWKVGVRSLEEEVHAIKKIFSCIGNRVQLRLDANGGLSVSEFEVWCKVLADYPIQYLEQPLPVGSESMMAAMADSYGVPLAFDESACTLASLSRLARSYPNVFYVVKPSQAGLWPDLQSFLKEHPALRYIYSSAFETEIGFSSVCSLVASGASKLEPGLGVGGYFDADGLGPFESGSRILMQEFSAEDLWSQL